MDPLSLSITKAIAYTENGGKPSASNEKSGKSGELKSIFQFEPSTWKGYSKEVTGQDDLLLTPANEAAVAYGKVSKWVKQFKSEGKSDQQIATAVGSLWNSGNPDPSVAGRGTNKEGVKYDAPAYAKKVADYATKFLSESNEQPEQKPVAASVPMPPTSQGLIPQTANPLGNVQVNPQLANAQPSQGLIG